MDREANAIALTAHVLGKDGKNAAPLGKGTLTLLLSDRLLDLDREVTVTCNGKEVFKGIAPRTMENLARSLRETNDPARMAPARVEVGLE